MNEVPPLGFSAECDNRSAQVIFVESAKAILGLITPLTICAVLCTLCTAISVFSVFFYRYEITNIIAKYTQEQTELVKHYETEKGAMLKQFEQERALLLTSYEKETTETAAKVRVLQNHVDEATNRVKVFEQVQEKRYAAR